MGADYSQLILGDVLYVCPDIGTSMKTSDQRGDGRSEVEETKGRGSRWAERSTKAVEWISGLRRVGIGSRGSSYSLKRLSFVPSSL